MKRVAFFVLFWVIAGGFLTVSVYSFPEPAPAPTHTCPCGDCRCDLCMCGAEPPAGSHEPAWTKAIAKQIGGVPEWRTPDGSRIDVLTPDVAWEVEWAAKWKEAPAQALLYGLATNRKPGVILLFKDGDERIEYLRCLAVCQRAGIVLRTIDTTKD